MTEEYIQFKRQRDLGEILSDTFRFIRENYKSLFRLLFKVTGPVFLFLVLVLAFYSYIGGETFGNPFVTTDLGANEGWFMLSFFLLMVSLLVFYVLLYAVVLHYIKSYIDNRGQVVGREVLSGLRKDFGGILGLILLVGAMVFLGLMLCVLPGIYLWAPLSLAPPVLVFGRQSIGSSISETFSLIKDHWWITFFSLLVIALLIYFISLVFQMPLIVYYFFKALTMAQEGSTADPSELFDWIYVVFNVVSSLAQYLLSVIFIIATAFVYYNLNEKKYSTGSFETISNLGSSENH